VTGALVAVALLAAPAGTNGEPAMLTCEWGESQQAQINAQRRKVVAMIRSLSAQGRTVDVERQLAFLELLDAQEEQLADWGIGCAIDREADDDR
jgi:hypothetical protein